MKNYVPIILILTVIGLFFSYIDPKWEAVKELKVERTNYEEALENSRKLREERDKLVTIEQAIGAENKAKLFRLLPDNIDNIRLIIDIDNVASRYGLGIRDFGTKVDSDNQAIDVAVTPYGVLSFSFSTTGTYNAFTAFLRDLERSLRLVDAVKIVFSVPDDEEGSDFYDYDVTVKTYWLR